MSGAPLHCPKHITKIYDGQDLKTKIANYGDLFLTAQM